MADDSQANSISVTVRVRPFTIREAAQLAKTDDTPLFFGDGSLAGVPQQPKLHQKGLRSVIKVVDDKCLVFDPPEDNPLQRFSKTVLPQGKRVKDQTFMFDRVFDDNTSQSDVYEATTKNLLDSVLDGYNATVFAYGATGCGKTHTITGTIQQPGIIFLTMQELFERLAELQDDKVTEVSLSYLEIYNETIRDLLVPGGSKAGLMLREDAQQSVSVAGLSSHHPQNVEEVMDIIVRGNEYRTMSPTEANATSSRSHAVLQINVAQRDKNASVNEPHTMATLSIIDLAGSERASATKNRGERLLEGANINKSLLALGSCINALCDRRQKNHVPYRNSKLTRLLKFSLGGNCKTVMIVCVSPSSAHFDETQNTLRYANRAKNIQTKVTRNVYNVNRHVKDFLKKIDEQMAMINELKKQQADYETVAFAKFRKQEDKKESIVKEGVARLRSAYDHCVKERQERLNHMKKLRQIERRIALIKSWTTSFETVYEIREGDDGTSEAPANVAAIRKTAHGILIELEGSRQHYHQRLDKSTWQRAIDTALQVGLKQLQEHDNTTEGPELETLEREAELIKSNVEREIYIAVLEHEKGCDAALTQVLLQAHFQTMLNIDRLLQMSAEDATKAATNILQQISQTCADATSFVIKPDAGGNLLPVTEVFPPTKAGTPKRRKTSSISNVFASTPLKLSLPPIAEARQLGATPLKHSPRRIKVGSAKKVRVSPQKRASSPVKRAVRWRDDSEEGGPLVEYSRTPIKEGQADATLSPETTDTLELPTLPSSGSEMTTLHPDRLSSSSPIPTPPRATLDINRPKADRFQAGFLARKSSGSQANNASSSSELTPSPPAPPSLPISSSPWPSSSALPHPTPSSFTIAPTASTETVSSSSPLQEIPPNRGVSATTSPTSIPRLTAGDGRATKGYSGERFAVNDENADPGYDGRGSSPMSSDSEKSGERSSFKSGLPEFVGKGTMSTGSDVEQQLTRAMRRASLSARYSTTMHGHARAHRRRSPPASGVMFSPSVYGSGGTRNGNGQQDNGLFTASHARRMVKSGSYGGERDGYSSSVLSPQTSTPISKSSSTSSGSGAGSVTGSAGLNLSASLGPGGLSGHQGHHGRGSNMRASISGAKPNWR